MKISLCITTMNRPEATLRCFEKVLNDDRVGEIVIVDDSSPYSVVEKMRGLIESLNNPKIKLFWNETNLGVYHNKYRAVRLACNERCIVFDSDNVIGVDYINAIYASSGLRDPLEILMPSGALPTFDYSSFNGLKFDHQTIRQATTHRLFDCWINTMNYVMWRSEFLKSEQFLIKPEAADSMFINLCLLKQGCILHTLPDLKYFHATHQDSHYDKTATQDSFLISKILAKFRSSDIMTDLDLTIDCVSRPIEINKPIRRRRRRLIL